MTLEGKNVLKEGWVTLFKSRKPTLFSHKAMVRVFTHKNLILCVAVPERGVNIIVVCFHPSLHAVQERDVNITVVCFHPSLHVKSFC